MACIAAVDLQAAADLNWRDGSKLQERFEILFGSEQEFVEASDPGA